MDTPIPTVAMVIAYLAWVLIVGPIYMADRKPIDLKNTLILYNAGQVLLSAYMFYEVSVVGLSFFNRNLPMFHAFVAAFNGWLGTRIQFHVPTC